MPEPVLIALGEVRRETKTGQDCKGKINRENIGRIWIILQRELGPEHSMTSRGTEGEEVKVAHCN